MIYLLCISLAAVVVLAARLLTLRREIRRLAGELSLPDRRKAKGTIRIAIVHKPLEDLCLQMNRVVEELDQARMEAVNHEAELRTQIANISHDLRTPLTAIAGYVSMVGSTPAKADEYLNIIKGRALVLQNLIEQFFELSVIEDSSAEWDLEQVDVAALLTECLLGYYTLFENKGISPETVLPDQAVMVIGNRSALERVFQNLIQNALKFARHTIAITLTEAGLFTISNDTQELCEDDMDHLFKRFYTADRSRTEGHTGLGLYIVKCILDQMGGSVESVTLEKGIFCIVILLKTVNSLC